MKRGKMKQLLVLILTGMLAVQSAGMPVFGVETGNTAFETTNEEEDVSADYESADDEAAYEPQEASNDADEVTTGETAAEAESDANMPNEFIAEDENSAAGAGSTEAASEYLNDGDNVTRDEPEEDTEQNNTTSHEYPAEDENKMADVGGTETASEYANPVINDEDKKIEQYTVTLDAKGGFFVNEWDDILNESVEKAEIINKVIYPGEAVYVIPVWEQENVVAKFIGWSLEPDEETVSKEQEQFVPVENCVLYAVWKYEEISPDENVSNATDVSETVKEDVSTGNVSEENVSPEEASGEELNESVKAEVSETASDSKGEDIRESDVEEASANTTALDENIDKEKPGHTVNEKDNEESVSCDPMLSSIPEASNHMWYQYKGDIDIRGYTGSSTIQTTYSNRGYSTVLQCDGNKDTLMFYNNGETVSHSSGLTVTPNIDFSSDGKYVIVRYTVKNTSASAKTYSLGVCADVDIDSDDHASVYRTNNGLRMVDRSTNRTYYLVCKNISGETSAGTLWFGYYGNRFENIFNDTSEVELTDVDSGMAFSWKDQIIPAGETASYVYQIGIGEAGAIVDYSEEENGLLHIDKTYQGMVGESVAVSATFISDSSPKNAVWTANDNTISFSGTSILGPFEGEKGNEYYLSTTATAQKAGYYDITLEVDGKTAHSTLFIANRSEDKGRLTITSGPITLETGRKYVVKAAYYDEAGNLAEAPGGIYWSTISGKNNGGEVNIKVVSDYYEYCLCEVTAVKAGTCGVFANTQSGLSAPVTFYVVNSAPAQKERVVSAQPTGHLSGSKNYDLAQTEQGTIDLSAPITSTVTIDARSVYSATGDIEIKNKGELIVQGKLNAQKINVRTGGKLTVSSSGHLNASEIVADGGGWVWQEGGAIKILFGGVLKTHIISVKGDGMLSMEDNSQLIAYQDFSYNAHETKSIAGTLYIGGSMDVGKSFKAPDSGFVTVFYNDPSSCTFSFHEKSRLGTIYAENTEKYNALGLSPDNITAAIRYFKVEKTDSGAWSYTPSTEKLETNWEQEVGAWARNLAKARETVIYLYSYPGLSSEDCDFVSRLAEIWVTSVSGQVLNKGFIETSSATYDLIFKLHNKEYKIRYSPFTSGAYANFGSVTFGEAGDEKMDQMGLTAAASTENFWSQATAYLAENRVKEYYQFVKGSLPKGKSEASLIGLLKKKGREFAEKYIDKVVEKYLFSTLKETGKSAEVKQIEKSFKVSKIVLNGDIEGLWKFVADEAKGTVSGKKSNSAQPAQTRTVNTAAGNEPESLSTEKKDTSSLDETTVDEGAMGTNESGGEIDFNQIEITDEFLKSALVDILGADADGNPDFSRQEEIEFLDLSGRYIQSLQGIQNFSGLKTLILENNEIADLGPLHDMTGLQYLDVSGQNITDISVISGLVNLVYLDISDNDIETLTGAENLTALKELIISDTRISSFATLENLETLQLLRASGIPFEQENLESLNNLNNLRELYMQGCCLRSLDGLNTDNLIELYVSNNQIESLDPICTARKLKTVDVSENAIEKIPSMKDCESLSQMDLSGNLLTELAGIADCAALVNLNVSGCCLVDSDLESIACISSLESLDISHNDLEDILILLDVGTFKSINITDNDIDIGEYIDLPAELIIIDDNVIESGSCGVNVRWMLTKEGRLIVYGKGSTDDFDSGNTPWYDLSVSDIRIGDGITRIGENAFSRMDSIQTVYIPENVTKIGKNAFSNCDNLFETIVPETVITIGEGAFEDCADNLVLYGKPDSCAEKYAFDNDIPFKYIGVDVKEIENARVTVSSQKYTGKPLTPEPKVVIEDVILRKDIDYTVSFKNNTDVGTATVVITGTGIYAGRITTTFSINKATQSITAKAKASSISVGNTTTVTVSGAKGITSFTSSNTTIATVNKTTGVVSGKKSGTVIITVTAAATNNYKSATATVTIKVTPISITKAKVTCPATKVFAGWALTPVPTVIIGSKTLKKGTDFGLSFKNNKNVGIATITITGKGNYTGTIKKNFKILPLGTTISKVSPGSKRLTVKWKKQAAQTTGYQIQYSSRSDFKTQKIVTASNPKTVSKTISGLAKKRKYYVRIRTYKMVGKTKYYSSWSAKKTVTTK